MTRSKLRCIIEQRKKSDEARCGYIVIWRELLQSMSWLRPGDKFDNMHYNLTYPEYKRNFDKNIYQFNNSIIPYIEILINLDY